MLTGRVQERAEFLPILSLQGYRPMGVADPGTAVVYGEGVAAMRKDFSTRQFDFQAKRSPLHFEPTEDGTIRAFSESDDDCRMDNLDLPNFLHVRTRNDSKREGRPHISRDQRVRPVGL